MHIMYVQWPFFQIKDRETEPLMDNGVEEASRGDAGAEGVGRAIKALKLNRTQLG